MSSKAKAGGSPPAGASGPAHLEGQVGSAAKQVSEDASIISRAPRFCQGRYAVDVAGLAAWAARQADAAALLAECCDLVGDEAGRWAWLYRRARLLSLFYSATHPQGAGQ